MLEIPVSSGLILPPGSRTFLTSLRYEIQLVGKNISSRMLMSCISFQNKDSHCFPQKVVFSQVMLRRRRKV